MIKKIMIKMRHLMGPFLTFDRANFRISIRIIIYYPLKYLHELEERTQTTQVRLLLPRCRSGVEGILVKESLSFPKFRLHLLR